MTQYKEAEYRLDDGERLVVTYDPASPCRICGLSVLEASVGGTDVCPWCDCGYYRDGCPWQLRHAAGGFMPLLPHLKHDLPGRADWWVDKRGETLSD
jgi:hypothetical protein